MVKGSSRIVRLDPQMGPFIPYDSNLQPVDTHLNNKLHKPWLFAAHRKSRKSDKENEEKYKR